MFPVLEESVPIVQIQRPPSRKLSQANIRSQNHLLAIENIYKELTKTVLELANKQYEKCILINCLCMALDRLCISALAILFTKITTQIIDLLKCVILIEPGNCPF